MEYSRRASRAAIAGLAAVALLVGIDKCGKSCGDKPGQTQIAPNKKNIFEELQGSRTVTALPPLPDFGIEEAVENALADDGGVSQENQESDESNAPEQSQPLFITLKPSESHRVMELLKIVCLPDEVDAHLKKADTLDKEVRATNDCMEADIKHMEIKEQCLEREQDSRLEADLAHEDLKRCNRLVIDSLTTDDTADDDVAKNCSKVFFERRFKEIDDDCSAELRAQNPELESKYRECETSGKKTGEKSEGAFNMKACLLDRAAESSLGIKTQKDFDILHNKAVHWQEGVVKTAVRKFFKSGTDLSKLDESEWGKQLQFPSDPIELTQWLYQLSDSAVALDEHIEPKSRAQYRRLVTMMIGQGLAELQYSIESGSVPTGMERAIAPYIDTITARWKHLMRP